MIIINGKKADIKSILSQYPADSVQRDIINILSESQTEYKFDTVDQLKFELMLRNEIIKAANELYQSNLQFSVFRKSKCNPEFWDRQSNGGFLLKSGVKPSDAIQDIFDNSSLYATECATAIVIIYYKALLNIFPKSLFDKLFPRIFLMNWHHIDSLLAEIGIMKKRDDYLPGDRRYIRNLDVDPLTPEWQGENVIDMGHKLFYGHGIGKHDAETIIYKLNKHRKEDATRSAFLDDLAGRPNFKSLAGIYYDYNAE